MSTIRAIAGGTAQPPKSLETTTQAPLALARVDVWERRPGFAQKLQSLDVSWNANDYGSVLDQIDEYLKPLDASTLLKLDAGEVMSWAAALYVLQQRMIALVNQMSMRGESAGKVRGASMLQRIGELTSATFARGVQQSNPGETKVGPWQVLRNTMKQDGFHSPSELEANYLDKLFEFVRRGGDLRGIRPVNLDFIKGLRSGELCEWVVTGFDEARVYRHEVPVAPNHLIAARGQDVLSAGSMRVFKNESGEVTHIVVGSFSGTYRPDEASLQHMVRHLIAAGVSPEMISVHEGEAGGIRPLSAFLLKLAGIEGAAAQRALTQVMAAARRWGAPPEKPEPVPLPDFHQRRVSRGIADLEHILGPSPQSRNTRILCNVGPDTTRAELQAVITAGAGIFRIDTRLFTSETLKQKAGDVRQVAAELGVNVRLIFDQPLQDFDEDPAELRKRLLYVDSVAVSVRSAEEVALVKQQLADAHLDVPVIARIDSLANTIDVSAVARAADGMMSGPGLIATAQNADDIPALHRRLGELARDYLRPLISGPALLRVRGQPGIAERVAIYSFIEQGTNAVTVGSELGIGLSGEVVRQAAVFLAKTDKELLGRKAREEKAKRRAQRAGMQKSG